MLVEDQDNLLCRISVSEINSGRSLLVVIAPLDVSYADYRIHNKSLHTLKVKVLQREPFVGEMIDRSREIGVMMGEEWE